MSYREKFFDQLKVVLQSAINRYSSQCGGKHIFLNQFIVKLDDESLSPSDNYSVSDAMFELHSFNEFMSASKIPARFKAWTINEATGINYYFVVTDIKVGDRCLSVCYVEDLSAVVEGDLFNPFPLSKVAEGDWRIAYDSLCN
jgi:hypothetical protein